MESINETLSNWYEGFLNYIHSFTVVEKQNKMFYFSKFSLVLSEFYQIYNFVKTLKENIFRTLIEQFKYCIRSLITFKKNLSLKEKVIILYSSCLLIYYKKFCFDTNNTFEQYYDNEFLYISSTNFGYQIINQELFKIFIFYYYSKIKKEITTLGYNNIKNLKKYYSIKDNNNNIEIKKNNDNKSDNLSKSAFSNISTNNSSNNDYFADPNILLPKNKLFQNKKDTINNITNNNNKINLNEKNEENSDNLNKINNNIQQENFGLQEQVLTYLTSTKERMVELVFEMGYKGYFPIFNKNINDRFQQFCNIAAQQINLENDKKENVSGANDLPQIPKSLDVNKNSINSINKNININSINSINDNNNNNQSYKLNFNSFLNFGNFFSGNQVVEKMNIKKNDQSDNSNDNSQKDCDNNSNINNSFNSNDISGWCNFNSLYNNYYASNTNNNNVYNNNNSNNNNSNNNSGNNNNNSNKYTKRIISELSKYEVDDKIIKIIEEVAKKIDSNYLDTILNTSPKTVTVINCFSCYIVEFSPEMLINIEPKYKEILQNYCIKFIVLAKELYNTAMELFTTIYDLSYTNIHTFIDLSKNCGIQLQYAQSLCNMFKDYSELLLQKKESNSNIKNILKKLFKQQKILWDKTIKQKADEFTSFYKVLNL